MTVNDPQPGYPFIDGYNPGVYGAPPADSQEVLREQADELVRRRRDRDRRQQIIGELRRRRAEHPELPQLDHVVRDDGFDVLFVRDEIVVSRPAYDTDEEVRGLLGGRRFREVEGDRERLPGGVLRLRRADAEGDVEPLLDTVRLLRRRGVAASINHIVPLAADRIVPLAVGKGEGGPVPAPGLPDLDDYAAGFPQPTTATLVAVIDGGIPAWLRADGWLVGVPRSPDNVDGLDALPQDQVLDAMAGHGAFVAGIVQRVAPRVKIRMYRSAAPDGLSTDVDVAAAMRLAVEQGAVVLNLSLGCQTVDNLPPTAMAAAVADIRQQFGDAVAIVAAAGNFADELPCWPAALTGVVSVGGLTVDLKQTTWSTRGAWVDCSTVGDNILSTYVDVAYLDVPAPTLAEPWARWTGTSFATAQVSGAVARGCSELGLTPQAAVDQLLANGVPVPDFGQAVPILPAP